MHILRRLSHVNMKQISIITTVKTEQAAAMKGKKNLQVTAIIKVIIIIILHYVI